MPALGIETSPPMDATPPQLERQEFHFEDAVRDGHPAGIVVKDKDDHIVFPSYVPPEINSPTSPQHAEPPKDLAPPSPDAKPKKALSDPAALQGPKQPKLDIGAKRPSVSKQWRTDLPSRAPGTRVATIPAGLKRAGTSYLDKALWKHHDEDDDSSSESSSSDEDDPRQTQDKKEAKARAQAKEKRRREIEEQCRRFRVGNDNYKTSGKVKKDGRLRISVKETANTGYLAKALGAASKRVGPLRPAGEDTERPTGSRLSSGTTTIDNISRPRLNIVIMVIGSRGDAQPFLKLGKILKEEYGHRVRIATHPAFRDFVEKDSGLEFFSVGGDPSELMAFMVKNPGMIPTLEAVKAGDIGRRRAAMAEMFEGFWRACINATDDEKDIRNVKMMGDRDPFVADAIIANPPSFAHIHCAEALGIPLHLMFTFPYTPTQAFPHPLASIKKSNVDPGYTNFISYPLVEMMVWQGLGDLVNDFRVKTLGLDPVSTLWAPGATYRLHVPFTYMWSPGLVPKPEDWGDEIDISGFVFLDLASTFNPPSELEQFLAAGEAPIYLGFGSIVVDDADRFTQMIFDAVKLAGVRALVSKGWGGLGNENIPDNIYMLENTPHDWLFPKVQACVIHGGAGTTAIALKCGKPTMIVPFFGDQHFWGSMVSSAGAGPEPVPYKMLTAENLAEGIKFCLTEEAKEGAGKIAKNIELEGDGAQNAVDSFHHHLNLQGEQSMRCSILEDQVAVWKLKNTNVKLSALAADVIVEQGQIPWRKLRLIRHMEWNDFEGPGEPLTGVAGSIAGTVGNVFGGIGSVPYRLAKTSQKRKEKKEKKRKARESRRAGKAKDAVPDGDLHQHVETKNETPKEAKSTTDKSSEGGTKEDRANGTASSSRPTQDERRDTMTSIQTASTVEGPVEDYAEDITSGVSKSAHALARAPVDLSLALAQGFHNAPRLYGDDTVRRPPRVTGIRSGLKAARFEFVYGIYDGTTGLVRLPIRGAKKGGVLGFVKGTGMGLTGFVLKDLAAIAGPVGYTLKGIAKQSGRGRQPIKFIRRARIAQGQRDVRALGDRRKEVEKEVIAGWNIMRELWESLEQVEKKKGLRGYLTAKKRRGLSAAFEKVETAEKALAAIKRGEDLNTVVGTEQELKQTEKERKSPEHRKSQEQQRRSVEMRRSMEMDRNEKRAKKDGEKRADDIPEADDEEGEEPTRPRVQQTKSLQT